MTQEHVILVDENDQQIGIEEKLKAYQQELTHMGKFQYIAEFANGTLT